MITLGLAVRGVRYLLDPLLRGRPRAGGYRPVTRLGELPEGVPRVFAVIGAREDAWVTYPPEPVGSACLVRQPEGAAVPVAAYTAECPHLGCAVSLAEGGRGFYCPCHQSRFDLQGRPLNAVPPRGMDRLDVQLSDDSDPVVLVRFQRFYRDGVYRDVGTVSDFVLRDGVRLCSWFLRAVFETKNKV